MAATTAAGFLAAAGTGAGFAFPFGGCAGDGRRVSDEPRSDRGEASEHCVKPGVAARQRQHVAASEDPGNAGSSALQLTLVQECHRVTQQQQQSARTAASCVVAAPKAAMCRQP